MLQTVKARYGPVLCSWVPLSFWHRLLGIELVVPYYHMVSDRDVEHVSGIGSFRGVQEFKADMECFLRFYAPVSLDDVMRYLDGVGRLPKRCFLLTFDDGFRQNHDIVAPILLALGIPAVFFVITSVVDNPDLCYAQKKSLLIRAARRLGHSPATKEASRVLTDAGVPGSEIIFRISAISYHDRRMLDLLGPLFGCDFAGYAVSGQPYLTSAQIVTLIKNGFAIGAHSVDHPRFSELSLEEQLVQTNGSLKWLSERFQYECGAFAFPFSDAGISMEYFRTAFGDGRLKVSFGTGGMRRHYCDRNLGRFSMENTCRQARQVLAREFILAWQHGPIRAL